ncbi:MAG: SDR family oxidoreductase [Candidatus Sericytochromatia bacterium]|nr:SDR family oxidoreductase [Candidatus Tanganyikabacteria bacterium]
MVERYDALKAKLRTEPRRWLVTGAAGFIGSNLVEALLGLGQQVVGIDNFATGFAHNLDDVKRSVSQESWGRFRFLEGDITRLGDCAAACEGVDYVLHQAALGSVPRSLEDPLRTHRANVDGFMTMLLASRDSGVKRFVFAASSSTYGDHSALPKVEELIGEPLSPYALSKYVNELYASLFSRLYGLEYVGLRYFNVFGPRQDPEGPYAAVIPRWISNLLAGQICEINGDGETSRDFCYVDNAIQANILAALTLDPDAINEVYNVAFGERTTLNELYRMIRDRLAAQSEGLRDLEPVYADFRHGDVRHSQADIGKAKRLLGFLPTHSVELGLDETLRWYATGQDPSDKGLVQNGASR